MFNFFSQVSPLTSVIGFMIGLPTALATYYQAFKARQEAQAERLGTLHSMNCLEFVSGDGNCVNLVPLETLHSLPRVGDVVLLPGDRQGAHTQFLAGAFLVESIEHFYTHVEYKGSRPQEARLTKSVAKVTSLNPAMEI